MVGMSIRVLVADDHPIVRSGVCGVLAAAPDMTVVAEAASGLAALEEAARTLPDVVVLDLTMPYTDDLPSTRTLATGLEAISALHGRREPRAPAVVVLSVHGEVDTVRAALAAGAVGYVLKESVTADLCTAVRAASSGNVYLSSDVAAVLAPAARPPVTPASRLSPREREVVTLIVEGLSSREIAEVLHTSPKTVEKQRRDAMRKLGVSNVAMLVRTALAQQL